MIKHHKTDSERMAWLAEARGDLQDIGPNDNIYMTRAAWEKLIDIHVNLLKRVRRIEAREGID